MQNTMEMGNEVATMQVKVGTFDTFSTVCQLPMYIIVLTTSSSAKKYSVLYVDVLLGSVRGWIKGTGSHCKHAIAPHAKWRPCISL